MKAILKQTSYVLVAQVLTRIISFFYIIYLARSFGVSEFGLYTVALAYFSIISSVADFGFNRFLIREVAKEKSKINELLWSIIMLRLSLTSVFFAIFALILYIVDPDKIRVSLVLLAVIAILPQSVAFSCDAIFIALQKLQFSALALFLSGLVTTIIGFILVNMGLGSFGAVNALVLGQLFYAILLLIILIKSQGFLLSTIKFSVIKEAFAGSLPYGLLGILGLLYFRIDVIILSYIRGSFETGIYGAAYKFLEAITFIPSAFSLALFPVLTKLHETSQEELKRYYFKSLKIMFGIGLFILAGYIVVLPGLIKILLPDYLSSIQAILILSLAIPFMFVHVPAVTVLLSTDKYLKQVLMLSVLTLIFNIVLNLLFIPKFGFIAASWVTVVSEVLSFVIFYIFVKRKVLAI